MDFKPLSDQERVSLLRALDANAGRSNTAILMDRRDTSFRGTVDDVSDEEVINAVRSVPTHY